MHIRDKSEQAPSPKIEQQNRDARFAMRLSLIVGLLMLVSKVTAYLFTGSSAIFSDAAESVVHVVAVAFAVFSLWLSTRPAVPEFHYGYERITFFSAGFEGAMIVLAAGSIIVTTTQKWRHGLTLDHLGNGVVLVLIAGVLNAILGWYLLRMGRRNHSLILEADGKHVLTDSWTSFGVVAGLALVMMTGWKPFDPLVAYAIAANILWSGGRLMWHSMRGLLDYSDPRIGHEIRNRLDITCQELGDPIPRGALPHHRLSADHRGSLVVSSHDGSGRSASASDIARGASDAGSGSTSGGHNPSGIS